MKKVVLLIDDDEVILNMWRDMLAGKVEVLTATSRTETEQLISENPDIEIAAVVFGDFSGSPVQIMEFVTGFKRRDPLCPMIAASVKNQKYQDRGGCRSFPDGKAEVPASVLTILGLS